MELLQSYQQRRCNVRMQSKSLDVLEGNELQKGSSGRKEIPESYNFWCGSACL